ncbi:MULTISPECIES: AlpA family transcriptional regulator [Pseudoalteromonas]|uniref:helix-turn-helix transcriptional regulator n=1 Tax=Pseudoalteromonas TaxID=53246 RepID=UPI001583D439|nr:MULTISPECIES: helix-turn-helix domain-containing protein [Pseudoalteromonas]MDI4653814.1 helix-turn-helix domain-containing protein [Pseudoalteromonas shioyasakiensis]NUJ40024.1 helix-turn-helix domain-containing protein [Pseudoalteromonas sp. 0303]
MDEKLLTAEELAKFLRSSPAQIYNILSRDDEGTELPKSIRLGRRRLWPESEVKAWISAQLTNQCETGFSPKSQPQPKTINRI